MTDDMTPNASPHRPAAASDEPGDLTQKKKEILSLPPAQALERLLKAPEAEALVRSFSEQDLFYLVQGIGPEDAVPVLSLASQTQWEYLFDIDIWKRDRIDPAALTRWLELIYRADAGRCVRWLMKAKTEFLEYYLFNTIDVRIREHDQDPSEIGEDYFSLDGIYYLKIRDLPADDAPVTSELEVQQQHRQKEFINRLLRSMAAVDYRTFQNILSEAICVIPAETEEEEYRLRAVRLAEKGLIPFEEAIGIYQPLQEKDLGARRRDSGQRRAAPIAGRGPYFPLTLLETGSLFQKALSQIRHERLGTAAQSEFAGLCNNLIMADRQTIRGPDDLARIVRKASGYLNIGLQLAVRHDYPEAGGKGSPGAVVIERYMLSDLFRVGYGKALALKWQAERWLKNCWFARHGLPLTFWGEEWLGVLGGLLIKRPLYFDNFQRGTLYREFETLTDIEATEAKLNGVMAVDHLLSSLSIGWATTAGIEVLTYKNLVLTLWARDRSGLNEGLEPIPLSDFKPFYQSLWQGDAHPLEITQAAKTDFLAWLSRRSGIDPHDLSERYAPYLEALFAEIEDELAAVRAEDLTPRYIHLFWISDR